MISARYFTLGKTNILNESNLSFHQTFSCSVHCENCSWCRTSIFKTYCYFFTSCFIFMTDLQSYCFVFVSARASYQWLRGLLTSLIYTSIIEIEKKKKAWSYDNGTFGMDHKTFLSRGTIYYLGLIPMPPSEFCLNLAVCFGNVWKSMPKIERKTSFEPFPLGRE